MPETLYTPPVRRVDGKAWGKPTHWYEDANGRRIPGVTSIINDGVPKPALVRWASRTTAEYAVNRWADLDRMAIADRLTELKGAAFADRDAAARRGTEVHDLGERLAHGQEVDVPDELAGHVEAYVRFLDEWEPLVVLAEATVVNYTIGYAGTLDLIADMAGQRWLLDLKTTRSGVFGETALQLAAYRYAEVYVEDGVDGTVDPPVEGPLEFPMPQVDRCGVVWVRADGYDVVPVVADPWVFTEFRYAARTARWQTDLSKQVIGEALPAPDPAQEVLPL
jgi:hypothetical protein